MNCSGSVYIRIIGCREGRGEDGAKCNTTATAPGFRLAIRYSLFKWEAGFK